VSEHQSEKPYRIQIIVAVIGAAGVIIAAVIGIVRSPSAGEPGSPSPSNKRGSPSVSQSSPPLPSASAVPRTPSATPAIRHKGQLTLYDNVGADLDSTAANWDVPNTITTAGDIWLSLEPEGTGEAIYSTVGQLAELNNLPPNYQGCSSTADFVSDILFSNLDPGANFCVMTDQGRYSLVHVTKISGGDVPTNGQHINGRYDLGKGRKLLATDHLRRDS
jgi:hypothetical protein